MNNLVAMKSEPVVGVQLHQIVSPTDEKCMLPKFFPGDVVETFDDKYGVIVEAQVIVNGCKIEWNEELPDIIEHGWMPSYSIRKIPGIPSHNKCAWWVATEWKRVFLGPLHQIVKR